MVLFPRREILKAKWGLLAFGVPLLLYAASLMPDVLFWDPGEMQTVPYILGIAHPTGFPAFVLSGWIFSHAFPFGNVAWRLSFLSAIAMATAAYAVHALALRLGAKPPVTVAAAWLFAVGEVPWTRGTRAEVHAFAVMFGMLAIVNVVRFAQTGERRALRWTALWVGLGLANHPIAALLIPGVLLIACRHPAILASGTGARACAIVLACVSLYLYLPMRSAYLFAHRVDPTLALGLAPGKPYWDGNHTSTWAGFKSEVLGEEFGAGGAMASLLKPNTYLTALPIYGKNVIREYGYVVAGAALVGLLFLVRDDVLVGVGVTLAAGLAIPFAVSYRMVEADVNRYYLLSYAMLIVFAAIGVDRLWKLFLRRAPRAYANVSTIASTFVLLALAAYQFGAHASLFEQRNDDLARQWIDRVRSHTPPGSLIIANWTYATPLAYALYVEHSLDGRVLDNAWVGDESEHLDAWLRKMPVFATSDTPRIEGYRLLPVDNGSPPFYRVLKQR